MIQSVINRVVSEPPESGHRISFMRLGGSESLDLRELYTSAGRVAAHLRDLGVRPADRVGILAANTLEWVLLDLASLRLKAVTAGFEPGKFEANESLVTRYGLTLLFTDRPVAGAGIVPVDEIRRVSRDASIEIDLPAVTYEPGDVTTLKFTSGSTGTPKGLGATAGSIDSSLRAVQEMFVHGDGDDIFVFLPLSLLQQRYWIYSALCFGHDVTVTTYEAAIVSLSRARPTVVMGVPAFFESTRTQMEFQLDRACLGAQRDEARRAAAQRVFGDRIRYLWTGSAPAAPAMLKFFTDAGLSIYEGYGLNETCIVSKNHPGAHKLGSVGRVVAGKRVEFDADGVLSVHSDYPVNVRYEFAAPGDSERVFGDGGMVRTGDLGHLDDEGFLFIRGRADDVIVLDNGKKVIVRPLEEYMKQSPAIDECVLFCPTQIHLVAVVSPGTEPVDKEAIAAQLALTNATFDADEQIKKVVIASQRFSITNGMLTSQFKPIRKRILAAYAAEFDKS